MGSNEDGRNYADVKLSVNLVDASRRQLFFLKEVNKYPDLYHGPLVREAIRRYGVDDAADDGSRLLFASSVSITYCQKTSVIALNL